MSAKENNPYVGPRSFRRDEGHLFFGRERESRDLLSLVASSQSILFYAQSGAGKSSLVNTRLVPNLEAKKFEVLRIGRVSGKDQAEKEVENIFVFNLICSLTQQETNTRDFGSMQLTDFLAGLNKKEDGYFYDENTSQRDEHTPRRKRALLIDQFEEIFTTHLPEWKKRDDFFHQLAQAMQDDTYLTVIIIMRDDYIASLDPYTYHFADCLRVRYYMQRLNRESALKAIKSPVAKIRPFAEGVAEKLVDDLASITIQKSDGVQEVHIGEYVEPVQLQVVCYELWQELSPEGAEISVDDLLEIGDVDQSLERFYDHRVATIADEKNVPERAIREWIQKELITAGRTRSMVLQNENHDAIISDEVIRAMRGDLLRGELRSGQIWYELSHDRLIKPVITSNAKWFDKHLSIFQKQVVLWVEQGKSESLLLRGSELQDAESEAESLVLTKDEKSFLQACHALRRREQLDRILRVGITAALIVSLLLLITATSFGSRANEKSQEAKVHAAVAIAEQAQAESERRTAEDLREQARARELASAAQVNLNTRLDQSILLSLEAYKAKADRPEAQGALFSSMQRALRLRGYLTNFDDTAEEFRYSPDGQYMAVSLRDQIILWDISEGNEKNFLIPVEGSDKLDKFGSEFRGDKFIFNPTGEQLVYLSREGLNFWDLKTPASLPREPINNHTGAIQQVVFGAEGKTFASLGENGDLSLWAIGADKPTQELRGDGIAFSADHTAIAILDSKSGQITITDMNGEPVPSSPIQLEKDRITSFALNHDGTTLAIGLKGGYITLWDLTDNTSKLENTGLSTDIDRIFFNSTGDRLVYETEGSERIATFEESGSALKELTEDPISDAILAVSPNGDTFVGLHESLDENDKINNRIELWNVANGSQINWPEMTETTGTTSTCAQATLATFSPDSKLIAIFESPENSICIVDISDMNAPRFVGNPLTLDIDTVVTAMAFSHDAKTLAIGAQDGMVELWDMLNPTSPASKLKPAASVSSIVFSPDDKNLIVGRQNGTFNLLDRSTANTQPFQTSYQGRITSFGFSPNGKFLYSTASDGIAVMDVQKFNDGGDYLLSAERLPGSNVKFVGPNEEVIVASGEDEQITAVWNTRTNKQITADTIKSTLVDISKDGRFAAKKKESIDTADTTSTITIWSTETGQSISEPMGGDRAIFSSDGQIVAITNSLDDKIILWNTSNHEMITDGLNGSSPQFVPQQPLLAAKDGENILLFDLSKSKAVGEPTTIKGDDVVFTSDGRFLAVTTAKPSTISLWAIEPAIHQIGSTIPGSIVSDSFSKSDLSCFGTGPNQNTMIFSYTPSSSSTINFVLWNITTAEYVNSVLMSSNPKVHCAPGHDTLITSSYSASINLWNMEKNKQTTIFSGTSSRGSSVDYNFSADDKTLMVTVNDKVTLWDTTTAQQIGGAVRGQSGSINVVDPSDAPHAKSYNDVVFSPENSSFAVLNEDGSISLWDVKAPPSIPGTGLNLEGGISDALTSFAVSPSGEMLALSTQDQIELFKTTVPGSFRRDKTLGTENQHHISEISNVLLSPKGQKLIAYHAGDSSFSFRDAHNGTPIQIDTLRRTVNSFRFSPDEKFLLMSPSRYIYIIYDLSNGKKIGDPLFGDSAQFSRDGRYISVYSNKNTYTILSSATGKPIGEPISGSMSFGPKESDTLLIKNDLDISLWKIEEEENKLTPLGSISNDSDSFILSSDALMLGIKTVSESVTFWKWDESGHRYDPKRAISPDKVEGDLWGFSPHNSIVYFYNNGGAVLYDIAAGEYKSNDGEVVVLPGDNFAFSPDEKFVVATYYYQSKITLIDITAPNSKKDYTNERFRGFGDDGKLLVTTNADENQAIFRELGHLDDKQSCKYTGSLNGATLSQDTKTLALFGNEGVVVLDLTNLQNCSSQTPLTPLIDPTGGVKQMLFTADGSKLATLGTDGLILWNVVTGETMSGPKLTGKTGRIDSFRFTQQGDSLIYISQNAILYKVGLDEMSKKDFKEPSEGSGINNVCPGSLSPFGKYVVTVSHDNKLQIQQVDKPNNGHALELRSQEMRGPCPSSGTMAFSPEEKLFALSDNNRIYIYTLNDAGEPLAAPTELIGKSEDAPPYYDLSFLNEKYLVTHAAGGRIFVWDIPNKAQIVTSDEIAKNQVFADGKMVIYLPAENQLVQIDLERTASDLDMWKGELCKKIDPPHSQYGQQPYDPNADYKSGYENVCPPPPTP